MPRPKLPPRTTAPASPTPKAAIAAAVAEKPVVVAAAARSTAAAERSVRFDPDTSVRNRSEFVAVAALEGVPLSYRSQKCSVPLKDTIRWYYAGQCNVAFVECYEQGTRVGTAAGSNFCVYMAHRRSVSNTGDWFDTLDAVHSFIRGELTRHVA